MGAQSAPGNFRASCSGDWFEPTARTGVRSDRSGDLSPGPIVVVTSIAALDSLRAKLGENVGEYQLVVASPRIAAQSQDFAQTTIAAGASDQALYDAILESL